MRLPRDLSGDEVARALARLGYRATRQTGSHLRLTRSGGEVIEHHVTIPRHRALRTGTLAGIIADVAAHLEMDRDDLLRRLFG